jgi:hypothetical protein
MTRHLLRIRAEMWALCATVSRLHCDTRAPYGARTDAVAATRSETITIRIPAVPRSNRHQHARTNLFGLAATQDDYLHDFWQCCPRALEDRAVDTSVTGAEMSTGADAAAPGVPSAS